MVNCYRELAALPEAAAETLLIPLAMRCRETRRPDAICRDYKALQIADQLRDQLSKFDDTAESMQLDIAVRTEILDERVGDFLSRHPDGLVVNLGAGLDARFLRLDTGQVVWYDLDLTEVVALRRQFFRETLRNPFLAQSVFDWGWIDRLCRRAGQPTLVIAEGLLPYLPEAGVWDLFREVARRLPGAEFVFQTISPDFVGSAGLVPGVNQTRAEFQWGIARGEDVVERVPEYALCGEWWYLDRHTARWEAALHRWWFVPDIRQRVRGTMRIVHLRVRPTPSP